jgi:hypothetical protein
MNNIINNIFANVDYAAEAENYIYYGVTDRDEIRADVRACMIESLKEYDIFELPEDFENDVDEYTDNIMSVIENS